MLAGSRLVFYISWETWHDDGPVPVDDGGVQVGAYQSQICARAVENRVFVCHANVAGCITDRSRGSHGGSRIIGPDGVVLAQGGIMELDNGRPEIVAADIDVALATALYANEALLPGFFLSQWWATGTQHVVHYR